MTAKQMAASLGYRRYSAANFHYGKLGRLVGEQLGWAPLPKYRVLVLVTFEKPGCELQWVMRPAVAEALERLGWIGSKQIPEEVAITTGFAEGAVREIRVNAYERSSAARERCISQWGCSCAVCGLKLADKYGEAAQGLIHVHHLRPLAQVTVNYRVDPVEDLRPVCPTCHAVIHRKEPPFTIEEVAAMIAGQEEGVVQSVSDPS